MSYIYLASRYSRRDELKDYADQLMRAGHMVTSRWLYGDHQISDDGLSEEGSEAERLWFAMEDYEDLKAADTIINFTEPPRSVASRGGRHVEFGMAVAHGHKLIVVGHRENVFHCLPLVEFFPDWKSCFDQIQATSCQLI